METTMAWTDFTRPQYARRALRYASDLTDREWSLIAPFMPPPRRLGRPRKTDMREVVNALLTSRRPVANGGCWRRTSRHFPLSRAISTNGERPSCGTGSTTISSWRHGNWREDGKTGLSHSGCDR
ncbi:transposase [Sinorhizobium meliloti]|uniref:transposase n=1 Tax=Rhizobium meliloti TaxID=382 RepID=UPI00398D07ED